MMNLTGDGNAFSEALDPKRSASWRRLLAKSSRADRSRVPPRLLEGMTDGKVLLISAFLFFLVCESSGTVFWLPQTIASYCGT